MLTGTLTQSPSTPLTSWNDMIWHVMHRTKHCDMLQCSVKFAKRETRCPPRWGKQEGCGFFLENLAIPKVHEHFYKNPFRTYRLKPPLYVFIFLYYFVFKPCSLFSGFKLVIKFSSLRVQWNLFPCTCC